MRRSLKKQAGFTLLELIVVIVAVCLVLAIIFIAHQ